MVGVRGPWELDGENLKNLNDSELHRLVRLLFEAETGPCGMNPLEAIVAVNTDAADQGRDASTPANNGCSSFIPKEKTCWQLKAGKAGEPAKLKGEVGKAAPSKTLSEGGFFTVIASGSVSGKTGEETRLKVLVDAASLLNLPTDKIRVIGSEGLAKWCSNFLPIVKAYSGIPTPFMNIEEWESSFQDTDVYQMSTKTQAALNDLMARFEAFDPTAFHTHIFGHLGVGKTRFVLEASKASARKHCVIYSYSPNPSQVDMLLDVVRQSPDVKVVLVVDECAQEDARALCIRVAPMSGQVHLITISQQKPVSASYTVTKEIMPLEPENLSAFLKGMYPGIPQEHISIITRYSSGYIKFARVIADSLKIEGSQDILSIMTSSSIVDVVNSLLGGIAKSDIENLSILALLESVGFKGSKEQEGHVLADHFGIKWSDVKQTILDVHQRYGIVPSAGDLVYVSPKPLALYLALRALQCHKEKLAGLVEKLAPFKGAQKAFLSRLREIATEDEAKEVCKELLNDFLTMSDFNNAAKVRVWAQLNVADPLGAAMQLEAVLGAASIEERSLNSGDARRSLVWTLENLCWLKESFNFAIKSLAHLAVAENESWSNNASGNFIGHFQIFLGGTPVPYMERLNILEELAGIGIEYRTLAIQALAAAMRTSVTRTGGTEDLGPRINEKEWQPKTQQEHLDCCRGAFSLLKKLISSGDPALEVVVTKVGSEALYAYHEGILFEEVRDLVLEIVKHYPGSAENLRKTVAELLSHYRFRKEEESDSFQRLERVHSVLSGGEFSDRLKRLLGAWSYDAGDGPEDMKALVDDFIRDPSLMEQYWPWLISGEANSIWEFGRLLGRSDVDRVFLDRLWDSREVIVLKDRRLLFGYLQGCVDGGKSDKVAELVYGLGINSLNDSSLKLQLIQALFPTHEGVVSLLEILSANSLTPDGYLGLAYGDWSLQIPFIDHKKLVLEMLKNKDLRFLAVTLVGSRLTKDPSVLSDTEYFVIVEELATDPEMVAEKKGTYIYDWKTLADVIAKRNPARLIGTIFEAQDRDHHWFLSHSPANKVLSDIARDNPALVWDVLSKKMEDTDSLRMFSIGFSQSLLDQLPREKIMEWCEVDPEVRAPIVAMMCTPDFSNDTSIFSLIAERFGSKEAIRSSLSACFHSRGWSGSEYEMWDKIEAGLEEVLITTKLPGLKTWIEWELPTVKALKRKAEIREEEERVRGF